MSLVEIWNKAPINFEEFAKHDLSGAPFNVANETTRKLLAASFVCNASALGRRMVNGKEEEPSGNKTEIALVNFMDRAGYNF